MALFRPRERFKDLRRSQRHELHYLALVHVPDQPVPVSCVIWDISETGAKLTIGGHHQVPDEFTLTFRRRCKVVRRDDGQVGVEFV